MYSLSACCMQERESFKRNVPVVHNAAVDKNLSTPLSTAFGLVFYTHLHLAICACERFKYISAADGCVFSQDWAKNANGLIEIGRASCRERV